MKIDFTQFDRPIDALALSTWHRNGELDISPEDAAIAGIDVDEIDSEYQINATNVNFQFTPDHKLVLDADLVIADIRSNNSLRSIRVRSDAIKPTDISELAKPITEDWNLHCFEEIDDTNEDETPIKVDAIVELGNWLKGPPDVLPSYLAQSDPNPYPGILFFRLMINPLPENSSLFVVSIQIFWRDTEFDQQNRDATFWERADAIIHLANDQTASEPTSRVANSLLYAAARYNAFDFWTCFDNEDSFNESKDEAIEHYVEQFRKMLIENFDEHLDRFSDSEKGG